MNDATQSQTTIPSKRRCTVTVSARAWHGSKAAAQAVGCGSISELLEKLGHGELAVVLADEVGPPLGDDQGGGASSGFGDATVESMADWPLEAPDGREAMVTKSSAGGMRSQLFRFFLGTVPKLLLTAASAFLIVLPILYVLDLRLSRPQKATLDLDSAITLTTGDTVAGYTVTDHMRIRPFHPVTGAPNVPHNGVDLATPTGTPVYAIGVTNDPVTVECWWDVDGGGWVAEQTTEAYPQLVFQSLHLLENECRSGQFTSGDVIALTGNSGLGSGEHYDFRVKLDGRYIDPPKQFVEAALTGKTLSPKGTLKLN